MLLIDDRAGSKSLISLPPLNSCTSQGCHGTFRLVAHTEGNFWLCSSNDQSHEPLSSLCRLDSADVAFTGNAAHGPILIGIEVKSIQDLLSSIATGRLQATQFDTMLKTYDLSYLLYYGSYRCSPNHEIQLERSGKWKTWQPGHGKRPHLHTLLETFLLAAEELGVRVKHCATIEAAALWISIVYRWRIKPWSKHKSMRTFDKSQDLTESEYRRRVSGSPFSPGFETDKGRYMIAKFASQFDGIGFEKAIRAPDEFDSILDMMTATRSRWERIEGVGKTIAKSVEETIRRKVR